MTDICSVIKMTDIYSVIKMTYFKILKLKCNTYNIETKADHTVKYICSAFVHSKAASFTWTDCIA